MLSTQLVPEPKILWAEVRTVRPALDFLDDVLAILTVPLYVEKTGENRKGKPEVKKLRLPHVVTSASEIFEANDENFKKLDLYVERPPSILELRWSLTSIKNWLNWEKGSIDRREVFQEIRTIFETYIDFMDPRAHAFVAVWTIGTYLFPLFNSYPYLFLHGPKGSGKTKTLTVIGCLAFNSIASSSTTTSSAFRLLQDGRCTFLVDEGETLKGDRMQDLVSILNAGYKPGFPVYRTNKDSHIVERFEVYTPKAIANIGGLNFVLEDRCVPIIMLKTLNSSIGDLEVNAGLEVWQDVRDKLYVLALTEFVKVRESYENVVKPEGISNRDWELWRPMLALADWLDIDGLRTEILEYARDIISQQLTENVTELGESILLRALSSIVVDEGYYKVSSIRAAMNGLFDEIPDWVNSRWIGRAMRRLGFNDKRRVSAGAEYRLNLDVVRDRANRYGVICVDSVISVDHPRQGTLGTERTPPLGSSTLTTQTAQTTPEICVDCHQPILDGSSLWWKGKDRVCRSCWTTKKLKEEHSAYAEVPGHVGVEEAEP